MTAYQEDYTAVKKSGHEKNSSEFSMQIARNVSRVAVFTKN